MWRGVRWVPPVLLAAGLAGLCFWSRARSRERIEDYSTAVNRYGEYARAYTRFADKQGEGYLMESCFGRKWDRYSDEIYRDVQARSDDEGYLRTKSAHFARLKKKYEAAVTDPESEIALDPPLDR
jgi:hypothetical protein